MKTTVKDFILDNMSDSNFERLVDTLIKDSVWQSWFDDELFYKVSEYLNKQPSSYTKNNSFEILNEIKKVSDLYVVNYKGELWDRDLSDLNDTMPQWMPKTNKSGENSAKVELDASITNNLENDSDKMKIEIPATDPFSSEDEIELDISGDLPFGSEQQKYNEPEYMSFEQLKIAFLSKTYEDIERNYIDVYDVNATNYQVYVHQEKNRIALALSNFIYEILHYTTEDKLENNFEQFSNERSHVKIDNDNEQYDGYCLHFLLDNRTRYISERALKAYYNRNRSLIKEEDLSYYNDTFFEFSVVPPKFVEYEELLEDLSNYENTYILAPFTNYLNEELIVPKVSEKVLYEILEQFIELFTHQGFTKEEQLIKINSFNESYEGKVL